MFISLGTDRAICMIKCKVCMDLGLQSAGLGDQPISAYGFVCFDLPHNMPSVQDSGEGNGPEQCLPAHLQECN